MKTLRSRPSASVLLALALTGASCSRPAPETRFLSFDPESSSGALTSGWSGFEKTPAGDTFVWAQAREAVLTVSAGGPADRLIRFRAWPFWWAGEPPQTVTIWVNDVRLETVPLGEDVEFLARLKRLGAGRRPAEPRLPRGDALGP